jgi:hypothetical protein
MGLPIPNLDDKTFDEIVKEARSFISLYSEKWTDHNVHDPGVTFIELFSWLAETYLYQLNRISDAQYLMLLKMVEGTPGEIQPATVDVTFKDVKSSRTLPIDTEIATVKGTQKLIFKTTKDLTLISTELFKIQTICGDKVIDQSEANSKKNISFHPFGKEALKDSTLMLGFDNNLPQKEMTITFDLFEDDLQSVQYEIDKEGKELSPLLSIDLVWEYYNGDDWKVLTINQDTTFSLNKSGYITFDAPTEDMAKNDHGFWIRSRIIDGSYEIVPVINAILLNTVEVEQIETATGEALHIDFGDYEQKAFLKKTPVIKGSQVIKAKNSKGEWQEWKEEDDFELSGPDDFHYTLDADGGEVTFGNGLNGSSLDPSQEVVVEHYQTTAGEMGNVPTGKQFGIENDGFGDIIGTNYKKSKNGKAAESIEEAILRAKKDFRPVHYRAITSKDFETLALSTPGVKVAKVKVIPNYNPEFPCLFIPEAVTVVVIPYVRKDTVLPIPSEEFMKNVQDYLQTKRLITTNIYVIAPKYVEVSIRCKVHLKKRSSTQATKKRVEEALKTFLDPLYGGTNEDGWSIGRAVFLSEIYQVIDGVEGVNYATQVTMEAAGHTQEGDKVELDKFETLYSGQHHIQIVES